MDWSIDGFTASHQMMFLTPAVMIARPSKTGAHVKCAFWDFKLVRRQVGGLLTAGRRFWRFLSRRFGQPTRQIAAAMHEPDRLQAITREPIEDEQLFERTFYPIGAQTVELWVAEMPISAEIRPV